MLHKRLCRFTREIWLEPGDFGCYSFHETKNIISGEGGLFVNNNSSRFLEKSQIIREKGTDRTLFYKGLVNKYTWRSCGSSYLPGEITAAFLYAQLLSCSQIINARLALWDSYYSALKSLVRFDVSLPVIPDWCRHNAHIFYLIMPSLSVRDRFIAFMKSRGISCLFHYVPLHNSPYGHEVGKTCGSMENTERAANGLVRLPLWIDMTESQQLRVINNTLEFFSSSL